LQYVIKDWKFVKKVIKALIIRALAAYSLVHIAETYILDVTQCEGPSMTPTISPEAEIVLVERISHRLFGLADGCKGDGRAKIARERQMQWEEKEESDIHTWYQARLINGPNANAGFWTKLREKFESGIAVGDVIVLEALDREGTVCKRVIGLPGDIVLLMSMYEGNRSHMVVVPDGHVWIEGDNSLLSRDSRMYGPVPAALIRGKVLMRIWPPSKMTLIERSPRPLPPPGEPFTGSMVIPAGYEGEPLTNVDK